MKATRKFLSVLLSAIIFVSCIFCIDASASTTADNSCDEFKYIVKRDNTIEITGYKGTKTDITIPDTIDNKPVTEVTRLRGQRLTSIIFPDSVVKIGEKACSGNRNLKRVVLPRNLKRIEMRTFYCNFALKYVTIPEKLEFIGLGAFDATSLAEIKLPGTLKTIEKAAFSGTKLKSVTIPKSVTSISSYSFYGCSSLKYFKVKKNNPKFTSRDGVLLSKSKKTIIAYPGGKKGEYIIPNTVKVIKKGAFLWNSNLTKVTIPKSVKMFDGGFRWCSKLKTVIINEGIEEIGYKAFSCSGVRTVKLPKSLVSIDDYAFEYTRLKAIDLSGNNLQSIGDSSFKCSYVEKIIIGKSLKKIGRSAFYNCGASSITIPPNVKKIGEDAFGDEEDIISFTIYGAVNSAAQKYAKANGFKFKVMK